MQDLLVQLPKELLYEIMLICDPTDVLIMEKVSVHYNVKLHLVLILLVLDLQNSALFNILETFLDAPFGTVGL